MIEIGWELAGGLVASALGLVYLFRRNIIRIINRMDPKFDVLVSNSVIRGDFTILQLEWRLAWNVWRRKRPRGIVMSGSFVIYANDALAVGIERRKNK